VSQARLRFADSHPAFAGHFPGMPVVPGALLLAAALDALALAGAGLEIASAKFLHPVAPEVEVEVHRLGNRIELRAQGRVVATAQLKAVSA
jgi:3-hydroxymyristoyl/3-hydroxydecanoyl-(acyl carrier protein) dehydratase